jgi:hypothetical protein
MGTGDTLKRLGKLHTGRSKKKKKKQTNKKRKKKKKKKKYTTLKTQKMSNADPTKNEGVNPGGREG